MVKKEDEKNIMVKMYKNFAVIWQNFVNNFIYFFEKSLEIQKPL